MNPSTGPSLPRQQNTFLRFPLSLLCSFLMGGLLVFWIENPKLPNPNANFLFYHLLFPLSLGLPWFTALTLFSESRGYGYKGRWALYLLGIIPLYLFQTTVSPLTANLYATRYLLISLAAHLLVSIAPFLRKSDANTERQFFSFNEKLFSRFALGYFYSFTLFVGSSLALSAIQFLFSLKIPEETYLEIAVILMTFFNSWFFLQGVPSPQKPAVPVISKAFLVLTQYILTPLLVLYFSILYAYMAKIIFTWSLPRGGVAYWVAGVSTLGILTFLLSYPLQGPGTPRWFLKARRYFYPILFPPLALLAIAVLKRISAYGITEMRYLLVALGLWLGAIALYFIFSKSKKIQIIPTSLCLLLLLSAIGPFNAFSVSLWSQNHRFQKLLTEHHMLDESGKTPPSVAFTENWRDEMYNELMPSIKFLLTHGGLEKLRPFFEEKNFEAAISQIDRCKDDHPIMLMVENFCANEFYQDLISPISQNPNHKWKYRQKKIYAKEFILEHRWVPKSIPIRGFDFIVERLIKNEKTEFLDQGENYKLFSDGNTNRIVILQNNQEIAQIPYEDIYKKLTETLKPMDCYNCPDSYIIPKDFRITYSFEKSGRSIEVAVLPISLRVELDEYDKTREVYSLFEADLLLKIH